MNERHSKEMNSIIIIIMNSKYHENKSIRLRSDDKKENSLHTWNLSNEHARASLASIRWNNIVRVFDPVGSPTWTDKKLLEN